MAYCRNRGTSKVDPCVALCNTFNSLCFKKASKNCFYEDYVLLRNQLLLLEYDEDDPVVPSKLYEITDMLRRYIEEVPKPIQETVEFVKDVHKKIFFLYGIATREIRDNRKFPNSQELHLLLVRYVELEYEVLYNADNYSPEYQKQVEKRVLSLLLTILQDSEGWQQRDQLEGNSEEICAMNTLHIMTRVRVEYKKQQNFVENIMYKLLRILNVLDKVSEMKNKNRTFQLDKLLQIPKVQKIFEYLQNRDYGLEDPNISEDEIEEIVEQAPSPMKNEVAYEVEEEEKYDISSFACQDTQKKVMTIDLIDEDFSMVYFRPEVQKLDKKDKKVAFDGYNVQISERTLSNISDKYDKYIQLNSVTTSSPCDNKPLNSRSAISHDRVFEVDDDSDSDVEIVQDCPSIVNLVNDSVVLAEPAAAKQECLLVEKSKTNEVSQNLQSVTSSLELEDALLQCDDISDNEIENEDEILNKYHDAADDVADVREDLVDAPYVGEDIEDAAADVGKDANVAAAIGEEVHAAADVGEAANVAADVGKDANVSAAIGEEVHAAAAIGEEVHAAADVGEAANVAADVGEDATAAADVGEAANAAADGEDASAAADVNEDANAAADVNEDANAAADVGEDLNEVVNVSGRTIFPISVAVCDKSETTDANEISTISNEKAHNQQDDTCSSKVACADGDYSNLNQDEKKFQTSNTMKVDSDRLSCNSAYETNSECTESHKNQPCTSDLKCVVENQKEGNADVPIDTSNLAEICTSNKSRLGTDVMPTTATNNCVIAETLDGLVRQHANKPAEALSAVGMDAEIFKEDHIKKTCLVGSKVLESSAQTVSVTTANSSFTVATEESFINRVTEKIPSSSVQLPSLPSECSTDAVVRSTPEESVEELIVAPEVNDDQQISAKHKASCEDQVLINTNQDIISNIEPEISDVQNHEVCVEEIVAPCIADEEQLKAGSDEDHLEPAEENKSAQEAINNDYNIQDQDNVVNQLDKQPSKDESLEPPENHSIAETNKTITVSEPEVITPPSVSYDHQTSSEDIEEYVGEFNATFTDHSCSNNLDVLASVAAEQKKMENSNEIARRGNKKKGRKVVKSMKITEKPKKKTKKSELAKTNKEDGVVTRRVTRSSAQLQYTTEVQDQSKCIPSAFMNLENLVTPTPNKIYNLIADTVIDNEESLDEPFTCVVSCENQQNSIDGHVGEILIKNPVFDEDTIEDGISFVCHKKLQSDNSEVVISIPDSEKNFPGINFDILEQAEQFAESNVSSNHDVVKDDDGLNDKVLSSNVTGLSEGYYQSRQTDAPSDVLPIHLNVCKNKIWQEIVVESSINVVEEIIENDNIVEAFEGKEILRSDPTELLSVTGSDPLNSSELVHSDPEIETDKIAESGQTDDIILNNVTQEITVNENETICATNNNEKLDEVKTGKSLVDEPSSGKITNFSPKKNRRKIPLSTTVPLLMPVKKRRYYSKKNIIINKYEKKNVVAIETQNTEMVPLVEIKNIETDTSKPQETALVEGCCNLNQHESVEATQDSVLDYSLSKKSEVGSQECLHDVFPTLTTENEPEEVVNHITRVVSAELVTSKDQSSVEVVSDASAKDSDINEESLNVNDVGVGGRTELEITTDNKEQSQEPEVNSSPVEEVSSCTIKSVVQCSTTETYSVAVEEVDLSTTKSTTVDSVAETLELNIEEEIDSTNSKLPSAKCDTETPALAAEEEINSCKTKSATVDMESITETPKLADDKEINPTSPELTTLNSVAEEDNSCSTILTTVDSVVEAPEFTAEEVVNSYKTKSVEPPELTVENLCNSSETKSTDVLQLAVEEVVSISETKLTEIPELAVEEIVHSSETKLTEIPEHTVEEVVHTIETKSTIVLELVEEVVNSPEIKSTEVPELTEEEDVYASKAIATEVQELPVEEEVNSSQSKSTELLPKLAVEEVVHTSETKSTEVPEVDEKTKCLPSKLATADCLKEVPEYTTDQEVHSSIAECNAEAPEPIVETAADEIVPSKKTICEIDQSVQFSSSVEPHQLHQPNAEDLVLNKDKDSADNFSELQINSVSEEVQTCENNKFEQNTEVPNQQILAKEPVHEELVLPENETSKSVDKCAAEVPVDSDQMCIEGSNISQNPPVLEKVSESSEISNKKENLALGEFENSNDARTMPTLEREISLNQGEPTSKSTEDANNQKETFPGDSYPLLAAYEIEAFTEEVVECCTGDVDSPKLLQSQENINMEKLVEIPKETEVAVEILKETATAVEISKETETVVEIPKETETVVEIPKETITTGEKPEETGSDMEISKETETAVEIPRETETVTNKKVAENSTNDSDKQTKKNTSKIAVEPDSKIAKIVAKPNIDHREGNRRVLTKAALKSFQNPYVQLHKLPENYDYKRVLSELAEKPKAAKISDQRSKSQDNASKLHKRDSRSLSESKHRKKHENLEKSEPPKREKRVIQKERDSRSKRSSTDYASERGENKRKVYTREDSFKTKTRSSSQKQRDKEMKLAEKMKVCRSLSESKIDLKSKQNETSVEKKFNKEKPKIVKELQLFSVADSKITYYDKRKKAEKEPVKHDSCVQQEKKYEDNQTVEPKSSGKEEKSPQSDKNEEISNHKSLIKESNSRSLSRNEKRSSRHAREKTEKEESETINTHAISSTADDTNKNESSYSTRRHSKRSMSISRSSENTKDEKIKDSGMDFIKDSKERSKKNENDKARNASDTDKIKTDKINQSPSSDKIIEVFTDIKKSSDHKRHRSSRSSSKNSIKFENKDPEETVYEKKKPRVEKNKENVCSPKSETEGNSKRHSRRKSISVDSIEKNSSGLVPKVIDVALVEPKLSKRERRESLRSSSSRDKSKMKSSLTENGSLAESDLTVGRVETCPHDLSENPIEKLVESKKLPKKRRLSEAYACELEVKNSRKSTIEKSKSADDQLELIDCKNVVDSDLTIKNIETEIQHNKSVTNKQDTEGTDIQPKEPSKNRDKKVLGKLKSAKKDIVDASDHEAVIDSKDLEMLANREVTDILENRKVEEFKKSASSSKYVKLIQHDSFTDVHVQAESVTENKDFSDKDSENVNSEVIDANDRKAPLADASNAENQFRTKTPELKFQDIEDDSSKLMSESNSSELAINNCSITISGEHNETVKEKPDSKEKECEAFSCETVTDMKEPTILTKIDSSPNTNHSKLEETSENQQEMVIHTETIKSSDDDFMAISNKKEDTLLEKLKCNTEGLNCDVSDAKNVEIATNEDDELQSKDDKSKSMERNHENSSMEKDISPKKREKVESKKKDPKRIDFIIENLKNRNSKRKKEVLAPTELVHDNVHGTENVRASENYNMEVSTLPLGLSEKQRELADVHREQAIDFSMSTTDKNEFVDHSEKKPVDQTENAEEPNDVQQENNANTDFKNCSREREMESNNCSSDAVMKDVTPQTVQEEVAVEDSSQHAIIASSGSEIYDSVEEAYLVEKGGLSHLAKNAKESESASSSLISCDNKLLEEHTEETVTDASAVGIQSHEGTEREKFTSAHQSSVEEDFVKSDNSLPSLAFPDENNSLGEVAIDANALHQSETESPMVVDSNLTQDDAEIEEIGDEDHLLDIGPRTPEIAKIMNDDCLIETQHLQTDATFIDKLKVRTIPNHLLHFKATETEKPYSKIENCTSISSVLTVSLKNDAIRDHAVPSTSGHSMNSFVVPGGSQVIDETNPVATSAPLLDVDKQQTEEVIVNLSTSTADTPTSCETTDNLIAVIFSNVALCNTTEVINDAGRNQPNKTGFIYFRGTDHNYHSVGDPLLSGKCDNSESDHSSDSSKEVQAPELQNVLVDDNILPYIPTLSENNLNQELSSSLSESPVDSSTDFQLLEQCLIGNTLARESSPPLPQGCDNLYQTNLKQEVLDYDDNSASSNMEFSKETSEVYINPFQQQTTMSVENMSELMNAVLTRIQNLNNMTRPTQRNDSSSKETLFQPTAAEINVNADVGQPTNTNSFMMNLESDCNFVPMQEVSNTYPESNVGYSNISFGNEMPETVSFETDFTNFYYLPVTHDTTLNNNCNKKVIVERIPQYSEQQMKYTEINNVVPSVSTVSTSTVNNNPITNVNVKPITSAKQAEPTRSSGKGEVATPIKPNNLLLDKIKQADSNEPVSTSTAINVGFVRTSSRTRVSAPRPKKPSDRKSVDTRESEESGTETDRSLSNANKSDNHILKLKVRADLGISNNSIIDSGQGHPAKERSLCIIEDSSGISANRPSNSRVCIEESKPDVRKSNKQPKVKDTLNIDDSNKLSAKTQTKQPKEDALSVEDLNKLNSRKHNGGSTKAQKQSDVINTDKPQLVKNQTQTQTVEVTKQTSCSVKDAKSQTSDLITSSKVTVQNKAVDKLSHSDMIDNVKRRKRKPVDYIERVDYSSIDKLLGYELENGKLPQRIRQKKEETGDVSPRPKKRKQEIVEDKQVKLKIPSKPCPDTERTKVDAASACSMSDAEPDVVGQSKSSIFEDSDDDIPKKKKSKPENRLEPDSMNDLFDRLVKEGNINTIKNANLSKSGKEMDPSLMIKESVKNEVQKLNKNTLDLPQTSGNRAISNNIFNLEQKKSDAVTPVKQIGVVNPIPRSSNVVRKEPPCNRNSYGGGDESRNSSQYYPYYSDRNRRSYPYSNRESSRSSHQGSSRRMEYQPHSNEQRYSSSQRSSSSGRSSRSSRHHSNSRSSTEQRNYNRYASSAANDLAWREDMKKKFPNMFKDEVYF